MQHHVFTGLAILGKSFELGLQPDDCVADLHWAGGPLEKQPTHARKALQVWNDGIRELVQQRIKSLWCISRKQEGFGLFKIVLKVGSVLDVRLATGADINLRGVL